MQGKKLAVMKGSEISKIIAKNFPEIKLVYIENSKESVDADTILTDKADGLVNPDIVVKWTMEDKLIEGI